MGDIKQIFSTSQFAGKEANGKKGNWQADAAWHATRGDNWTIAHNFPINSSSNTHTHKRTSERASAGGAKAAEASAATLLEKSRPSTRRALKNNKWECITFVHTHKRQGYVFTYSFFRMAI